MGCETCLPLKLKKELLLGGNKMVGRGSGSPDGRAAAAAVPVSLGGCGAPRGRAGAAAVPVPLGAWVRVRSAVAQRHLSRVRALRGSTAPQPCARSSTPDYPWPAKVLLHHPIYTMANLIFAS